MNAPVSSPLENVATTRRGGRRTVSDAVPNAVPGTLFHKSDDYPSRGLQPARRPRTGPSHEHRCTAQAEACGSATVAIVVRLMKHRTSASVRLILRRATRLFRAATVRKWCTAYPQIHVDHCARRHRRGLDGLQVFSELRPQPRTFGATEAALDL